MKKNAPHIALALVIILAITGFHFLYDYYQERQRHQNRTREIKGRLSIIQNLDNQNYQAGAITEKQNHTHTDSSKISTNDQPGKEEDSVEQKGGAFSKVSSTDKIIIYRLIIVQ